MKKNLIKPILVLTLIALICSLLVCFVNKLTLGVIF